MSKKEEKKEKEKLEKEEKEKKILELRKFLPISEKPETIQDRFINHYAKVIANADRVVVFTGAGMSAESGISTFRGAKGVWSGLTGVVALGYFGTPVGWKMTSRLAYKLFRKYFFDDIGKASPNIGHYAIGELCKYKDVHVVTQNVDGLHQLGGVPDERTYEVHGTVRKYRCIKNGHPYDMGNVTSTIPEKSPKCKICKSYIRPDFTLFTEALPSDTWKKAINSVYGLKKNDVMIVVGTSSIVYPAASIPEIANQMGVKIVEINLVKTKFSGMTNCKLIEGKAGEVLTKLIRRSKHYINNLKKNVHEKINWEEDLKNSDDDNEEEEEEGEDCKKKEDDIIK